MKILPLVLFLLLATASFSAPGQIFNGKASSYIKARFAHYDRDFSDESRNREQTGTGFIFGQKLASNNNKVELEYALYSAQEWHSTGFQTEDLFAFDGNRLRSFSSVGEANVSVNLNRGISISGGRFQHNSLLLKSKTRVLPSTFEGFKAQWHTNEDTQFHASRFTKWSRRADDNFIGFSTEVSAPGSIDHLLILGAKHRFGEHQITAEYLKSKDHLSKFGIVIETFYLIASSLQLELDAGVFTSRDAGDLFVANANGALDVSCDNGRLRHRGLGGYLQAKLVNHNHTFELAVSQFSDPWLEDSFDNDHGTTPFPTKTFGPELTNKNEQVWLASYQHELTTGRLRGLSAQLSYARGFGAENSVALALGTADEQWVELDIKYRPPQIESLYLRLRGRDYRSELRGDLAGVASDRYETRLTIDYQIDF